MVNMKQLEILESDCVVLERLQPYPEPHPIEDSIDNGHYRSWLILIGLSIPLVGQAQPLETCLGVNREGFQEHRYKIFEFGLRWMNRTLQKAITELKFEKKNKDTEEIEYFEIDRDRLDEVKFITILQDKLTETESKFIKRVDAIKKKEPLWDENGVPIVKNQNMN